MEESRNLFGLGLGLGLQVRVGLGLKVGSGLNVGSGLKVGLDQAPPYLAQASRSWVRYG